MSPASSPDDANDQNASPVDAFILFNEREGIVRKLAERLASEGLRTYFWDRDINFGAEWQPIELQQLNAAKVVLVFLGSTGWGPTHERLVNQALRLGKLIIPVLVGDPPEGALLRGGRIFQRLRYVELSSPEDQATIHRLVDQIRSAPTPVDRQFDALISSFVDGNEESRFLSLQRVRSLSAAQRVSLAIRLRAELTDRFSPERVSDFLSSPRNQDRVPSIRSWLFSALIWSDVESKLTEGLIRREVGVPGTLPFWLLAGLYQTKASYLTSVASEVASSDLAKDAVLLAKMLLEPDDAALAELHSRLASDEFEQAWPALRVLRVLSRPGLVQQACRLFVNSATDTPMAYDSLYALCSNPAEAATILSVEPGIQTVVARIAEIASVSDEVARRNFVVLLAAFHSDELERALVSVERETPNGAVARGMRSYLRDYRQRAGIELHAVAGFISDEINIRNDFLGFARDVDILSSVMISKAVTPPLAIGLFGDWGSGKSHFMQSMEEAVKVLGERARASDSQAFCRHVVQIRFNAWHYVDTDLWASLVSHILERLADHVNPAIGPAEQRANLLNQLTSAQDMLTRAEATKKRVDGEVTIREGELKAIRSQREQKRVKLRDLRLNDLRPLLEADKATKDDLEKSLENLGVHQVLNSMSDLSAAIEQAQKTSTHAMALFDTIFSPRSFQLTSVVLLAVALVGIPGLVWLLGHWLDVNSVSAHVSAWAGAIVALAGAVVPVIKKASSTLHSNLKAIQDAKTRVDDLFRRKREATTAEEADLTGEIAALEAQEKLAASQLADASARVAEIEQRIRTMAEESSLEKFLDQRSRTDDYRKRLGLISIIRRDLSDLRERLSRAGADGNRNIERVILYIDDLDRCGSVKVMEVLQAVHLLLAFDLFVVVVGVDPRWLLHALREEYTVFAQDHRALSQEEKSWQATPQNYLEKIFQIPYCLPRMTADGFGKMVNYELAPFRNDESAAAVGGHPIAPQPIVTPAPQTLGQQSTHTTPKGSAAPAPTPQPVNRVPEESGEVIPEALALRPWEIKFAERLVALIPTPRAVKRFANTYRILKASVAPTRLLDYEGTEQFPGDFQVPMMFLAMLIGAPADCVRVFPQMLRAALDEKDIGSFLNQDLKVVDGTHSTVTRAKLREIVDDTAFPKVPKLVVEWLPQVARFSFDVGRSLLLVPDGEGEWPSPYET